MRAPLIMLTGWHSAEPVASRCIIRIAIAIGIMHWLATGLQGSVATLCMVPIVSAIGIMQRDAIGSANVMTSPGQCLEAIVTIYIVWVWHIPSVPLYNTFLFYNQLFARKVLIFLAIIGRIFLFFINFGNFECFYQISRQFFVLFFSQ